MKLKDDLIKMEEVQKRKIELDLNRETKLFYKKNKNKSIKSFRI